MWEDSFNFRFSYNLSMIKSGITKIDDFLNGGFQAGLITDIFGSSASGKSQLVFQICANAVMNNHSVLFQDTKGEFRPERILEILKNNNKEEKLLEKIKVLRITNTSEQISHLSTIQSDFSLVIIDNVTELFSFEFNKDEQSFEKNKIFMKYMHNLATISLEHNIPIIITNMIRNNDEKEIENLEKAINPFTHVKIHLLKNSNSIVGDISSINKKSKFSFVISSKGVTNES